MMKQQYQPLFLLTLLLIFLSHCTKTLAQGPAAAPAITSPAAVPVPPANAPALTSPAAIPAPPANAPAPPGPTNVTKILEKAGGFNVLIRLLKTTQVDNQLYGQLNKSSTEFTLLAPSDSAFSKLKGGSMNSLSVEQKVKLLQFHLIPDYLTTQNFQTVSNPVRTQVGDGFEYPLNITTSGKAVNISTGLVNTSISDTVYSDGQLAIYQVDSVLQPYGIFAPKLRLPSPASAPGEEKPKEEPSDLDPVAEVKSGAVPTLNIPKINGIVSIGVALLAAAAINFL